MAFEGDAEFEASSSEPDTVNLNELELDWSEQLQNASLVVQVDYRDVDAVLALKRIGYYFQVKKTDRILREYPASLLVGLNYVASSQMQQGTLWPYIFAGLNGLKSTQPLQEVISRLHRLALNKFRLERFEHPLGRIGEILLHAGIPVSSQEKFVRRLIRDFRTKADFDQLSFNEAIRAIPGDRVQAASLDKQIWHFINQAGNVADDFVAKCIEVLDDPTSQNSGAGLPPRIISEVARLVDEIGKSDLRRSDTSAGRVKPPRIVWSGSANNQLEVVFPALPESRDSAVRWTVEADNRVETVDIAQEIPGLSRQERSFELSRPAAQITVHSASLVSGQGLHPRTWTLTLFPEEQPVMFFDGTGQLELGKGPLQPELLKVLLPRKTRLGTGSPLVNVEGEHRVRPMDAPLGWGAEETSSNDWFAVEIDSTNAESVEIIFGDLAKPLRRAISAFRRPKPLHNGLLLGVFDSQELPTYSEFPDFEVGSLSLDGDEWSYSIRTEDRGLVWSGVAIAEDGKLRAKTPKHLCGHLTIQVSRGFGQTVSVSRTVIQGLRSSYDGAVRKLRADGKGLEDFSFSIFSEDGDELSVELSGKQRSVKIESSHLDEVELTARPNYEFLELFNTRSKKHTEWIEPTKSNVENLTELQLFFSSGIVGSAGLVGRWPGGASQVLAPRISSPWFKFNLGELSDAANARGAFRLELQDNLGRVLQVGTCYPKKLYSKVTLESNVESLEFEFQGGQAPEGLQLALYSPMAPWREPLVVEVNAGSVSVPETLRSLGVLAGTVAVSSPWAPHDFGREPNRESSNTFEFDVLPPDERLSPEQALVHWVMTGEEAEQLRNMGPELAWTCFTKASELRSGSSVKPFAIKKLAAEILSGAANALGVYPASNRSRSENLVDLIESGLITQTPETSQIIIAEQLSRPVLAAVGTALDDLESSLSLFDFCSSAWGATHPKNLDSEENRLAVFEYKLNLLNFRDRQIIWMMRLEDSVFAQHADGYLPGRLLDGGNIFLQVFKVLYSEAERLIEGLGLDWTNEVSDSVANIRKSLQSDLKPLLAARPILSTPELRQIAGLGSRIANWPSISIRMAFAARLAARGSEEARLIFETNKSFYLRMAKALPSLIEIDITIAELALRKTESEA